MSATIVCVSWWSHSQLETDTIDINALIRFVIRLEDERLLPESRPEPKFDDEGTSHPHASAQRLSQHTTASLPEPSHLFSRGTGAGHC